MKKRLRKKRAAQATIRDVVKSLEESKRLDQPATVTVDGKAVPVPAAVIEAPAEPAKIGRAGSMKQAAALIGIPLELLKAAKNAGCPGIDDHHRVDCDAVNAWLEDPHNQQAMNSPAARKANAEARHEELKVERIEHRLGVDRGIYIEKQPTAERLMKLGADQARVLRQKLENEFPAKFMARALAWAATPERDDAKLLEEIREDCRKVVDQLHELMQGLVKEWTEEAAA